MFHLLNTRHVLRASRAALRPHSKRVSSKAQGQGMGSIALGIGLGTTAAALTGTALYAAFNPSFRESLVNKVFSHENLITQAEKQEIANKTKLRSVNEEPKNELENNEQLKEDHAQEPTAIKENFGAEKDEGLDLETQMEAITKTILELQSALHMSCLAAVSAHSLAAQAVRGLTDELDQHAKELQDDRAHQSSANDVVVLELLEKNRDGKEMVHAAEKAAILARSHIEILKKALSDMCCADIPLANDLIEQIETSLAESEMQLGEAEEFLKQALTSTEPPEILQKRVAIVTSDLEEELGFSLLGSGSSEQREAFLRALAWQLLRYRDDVEHTLASHEKHTKELLAAKGEQGTETRLQALVEAKEAELKHNLSEYNFLNLNQFKKKLDHEINEELRLQQWKVTEAKQMSLREKRAAFDRELTEQWNEINYLISENKQNLIEEFNKILPNLTDIERAIKQSSDALILSTMSHSMVDALRTDPFPQLDWSHQIQPIEHLVATMQDISCDGADEFVNGVVKFIPNKALNCGVYTLNALKKRFYEVEKLARKVSLLKERDTNSLLLYLMSYLRSLLFIRPVSVVSLSEKQNKPKHQSRLNNEEILDRAKFFMEQGDFRQAISYMNLLQGVAQFVSSGWSEEMLIHLEVMQAAQTLAAFSSHLVYHNTEHN